MCVAVKETKKIYIYMEIPIGYFPSWLSCSIEHTYIHTYIYIWIAPKDVANIQNCCQILATIEKLEFFLAQYKNLYCRFGTRKMIVIKQRVKQIKKTENFSRN